MEAKYGLNSREDEYFRSSSVKPSTVTALDLQMERLNLRDEIQSESQSYIPFPTLNLFAKTDFDVVELMGKGAYGKVVKAMYSKTMELKAIKIIDKSFIEKEHKLYQVYLENEILQRISHPNIIKIDGIFEECNKIFMVLELLTGGDFYEFLKLNGPLKYETSQYFAGQIVNALEYLHGKGIAHRDLKPENLMLDKNHHIKLIDFATCKIKGKVFHKKIMNFVREDDEDLLKKKEEEENDEDENSSPKGNRGHKNTFVGTAEYVSPEVLVDQESSTSTDLWALGCIIYQMFAGYSPFRDKTEYLVFRKILELKFVFPENENFPDDVKDLVKSLLVADPSKRLGCGSSGEEINGFKALKSHPFFTGLDFDNLNKMEPPFKSEFKAKTLKNKQSLSTSSKSFELTNHKNTIKVIKQEIIDKKSPWFHYNTRKVVLDNTPKIEYIDPEKNIVKGVIYLTKTCYARFVDNCIFELYTPKRTFKFRTAEYESGVWSKIINEAIEKYAKV